MRVEGFIFNFLMFGMASSLLRSNLDMYRAILAYGMEHTSVNSTSGILWWLLALYAGTRIIRVSLILASCENWGIFRSLEFMFRCSSSLTQAITVVDLFGRENNKNSWLDEEKYEFLFP